VVVIPLNFEIVDITASTKPFRFSSTSWFVNLNTVHPIDAKNSSFFRSCDWRTVNANRIEPLKANRRDIPDPGNPERMTGRAEQLSPRSESHSAGHARPGLHHANHSAHFDLAGRVID